MKLGPHWPVIRSIFREAPFIAVASVNPDGSPHVSPIGSVLLRSDCTGYFLERFTTRLPKNAEHEPRVCLMAVNGSPLFWLAALARGRFLTPPAVRLVGRIGPRRPATDDEQRRWRRRVRRVRWLKGHDLLWKDCEFARDITFEDFAPVLLGRMTQGCWMPATAGDAA